jgi:hypothetical protein
MDRGNFGRSFLAKLLAKSIEAVNERSAYHSQNVFSRPRAVVRTYGPC